MPVDLREQLHRAAGHPDRAPDVALAIRRGTRLRRKRHVAVATSVAAVALVVVAVGAAVIAPPGLSVGPVGDPDGSVPSLEVFQRPQQPGDELRGWSVGSGAFPRPWLQLPSDQLAVGRSDAGPVGPDLVPRDARLVYERDDGLQVRFVPSRGRPSDDHDRPWMYVAADMPGRHFFSSVPVPAPGQALWAGSIAISGTLTGVIVVGDGLDTAHTDAGAIPVRDNVVVVEGFGYDSTITLSGPAGETTLTAEADRRERPSAADGRRAGSETGQVETPPRAASRLTDP